MEILKMKITPSQIKNLTNVMYKDIGGEMNPDIKTYKERATLINREDFFKEIVWALWSGHKTREANQTFLNRAVQKGFLYDFQVIASWDKKQQEKFLRALHGWTNKNGYPYPRTVPKQAINRWNSIFFIANELSTCKTDQVFRDKFFGGKTESISLDITDINRLISFNIPYLKKATAEFVIKNVGAESIKEDMWINEFLSYTNLSFSELKQLLIEAEISLSFFDTVLWCYCKKYIHEAKFLKSHFDNKLFL
jgi:hypothetical protein